MSDEWTQCPPTDKISLRTAIGLPSVPITAIIPQYSLLHPMDYKHVGDDVDTTNKSCGREQKPSSKTIFIQIRPFRKRNFTFDVNVSNRIKQT